MIYVKNAFKNMKKINNVNSDSKFKKNRVAVIIASYNYGNYLIEAVESVLHQIRPADEILISDDCSTDNTYEIAVRYKKMFPNLIKINRNDFNMGIVEHFNKAIKLVDSDYVCFLGADNRFRNDYLEKTVNVLDENDDLAIAYTDFALFGSRAEMEYNRHLAERKGGKEGNFYIIKFPDFNENTKKDLQEGNFIHGSSLFRKKAFDQIGGYIEKKGSPEDYLLFLRMVNAGWGAMRVPEPILEYRQHSLNQANQQLNLFIQLEFYKSQLKQIELESLFLKNQINSKNTEIQQKNKEINVLKNELEFSQKEKNDLGSLLNLKDDEIYFIKSSKFWKVRENYLKYKSKVKWAIFCPKKFFKKYFLS